MFTNKVRQQLYSSNLLQYFLYQTTARDLGQLQKSRNPLLYPSGRQGTTHVYLFNLTSSWRTRTLFAENRDQINLAMYNNGK